MLIMTLEAKFRTCSRRSPIEGRSRPTRAGADALAKRIRCARARRLKGWKSAAANNYDSAFLALAATPGPKSALARWFHERAKRNGGRLRKTMIVALARKLLIALWKYVNAGVVIEGAIVKAAYR